MEDTIVNSIANTIADKAQEAAEGATQTIVDRIYGAYNSFIGIFPEQFQWVVSVILVLAIAAFLYNQIKKHWLWIVLAVVIFPGILPMLKNIVVSLTAMFTGGSPTE
ncbi:hypothetical protein DRH29_00305 [candidate division Kazan bacterium]|uniref:Uncharacterized protein n=1 Tax=candidate division Kazan bacterium TaxID=2202143 RepID=A0A420ZDV7_UNCK3|nr:MAG: hypothetical protein DRH29_00305 [candidate division Kazan bacterium]